MGFNFNVWAPGLSPRELVDAGLFPTIEEARQALMSEVQVKPNPDSVPLEAQVQKDSKQ